MKSTQPQPLARRIALVLALSLTAVPVWSQTKTSAPAKDAPSVGETIPVEARNRAQQESAEAEDDAKQMSPFVVQTSPNDVGYFAENTLAGSRINTNLGDLAASITVVTRQQMLDTASIDMNDVFMYEANTEGTNNGYTSYAYDGTTFRDFTQSSPVTANRMRGIGAADRARNYYSSLSQIPFDVYNTETIEINRGPNSLLFGLGSAAGIVNQSSSNASLTKNYGQLGTRVGKYSAFRASLKWTPKIGQGGSLRIEPKRKNDPYVQKTTSAQSRVKGPGRAGSS